EAVSAEPSIMHCFLQSSQLRRIFLSANYQQPPLPEQPPKHYVSVISRAHEYMPNPWPRKTSPNKIDIEASLP
ncbi:hypothetical protein, partial [Variovorax boronicumulans]|uniref:hypothetical protein n=1 Tax=Variovorax boronicumulans TaxID=436515 RepID=UPI0027D832D2